MHYNVIFSLILLSCSSHSDKTEGKEDQEQDQRFADVLSVKAEGDPKQYSFTVALKSPDTGILLSCINSCRKSRMNREIEALSWLTGF